VLWVRQLSRQLAAEGRTVFLSSHLMSEMAQTADHLIVLGRGRVVADAPVADILAAATGTSVTVRTPRAADLARLIASADVTVTNTQTDLLQITGLAAAQIGEAAAQAGIALHELTPITASLEEAYLSLTENDLEYKTELAR
jgi:ABC-2 type transport system ATP-binding protein